MKDTYAVAPLAGSVDRNANTIIPAATSAPSLPSRGAWIEMLQRTPVKLNRPVAPLAGSVDRNFEGRGITGKSLESLPSRGAWIEILFFRLLGGFSPVAPLAGSVDRNNDGLYQYPTPDRRSPRGERG